MNFPVWIHGANRSLTFFWTWTFPGRFWAGWSSEVEPGAWRNQSTSNSRVSFSFCNCAKWISWLRSRSVAAGHEEVCGSDLSGKGSPSYKGGLVTMVGCYSLRKHLFLLALRCEGHIARRNVCDSATEIPYWWHRICPESGQKGWLVDEEVTLF